MRRSIRDAIVGFSIFGGVVAFASTMLWLRGVRFSANSWNITANFEDASGLAERSPVTYRGILVGSVQKIKITPESIQATLEINNGDLQLSKPVIGKEFKESLFSKYSFASPRTLTTSRSGSFSVKMSFIGMRIKSIDDWFIINQRTLS